MRTGVNKMIKLNKYKDLGKANHGWLNTSFHFSFADYYNPERMNFGSIRVLNDDYIKGHSGFDPHPHRDMEIITYIVEGELTHKDSMGNESTLSSGGVQYMSAGTKVVHSEYNNAKEELHLYQIWILPNQKGLTPNYGDMMFDKSERDNKFLHIVSNQNKDGKIFINQEADIFVGEFDKNQEIEINLDGHDYIYLVLIDGELETKTLKVQKQDSLESSENLKLVVKENSHLLVLKVNDYK